MGEGRGRVGGVHRRDRRNKCISYPRNILKTRSMHTTRQHRHSSTTRPHRPPPPTRTEALGTGVDWPNIQMVFIYDWPDDIDEWWQQSGRAGRNPAIPAVVVTALTFRSFLARVGMTDPTPAAAARLCRLLHLHTCTDRCRRAAVMEHLGGEVAGKCCSCDVCLAADVMATSGTSAAAARRPEEPALEAALATAANAAPAVGAALLTRGYTVVTAGAEEDEDGAGNGDDTLNPIQIILSGVNDYAMQNLKGPTLTQVIDKSEFRCERGTFSNRDAHAALVLTLLADKWMELHLEAATGGGTTGRLTVPANRLDDATYGNPCIAVRLALDWAPNAQSSKARTRALLCELERAVTASEVHAHAAMRTLGELLDAEGCEAESRLPQWTRDWLARRGRADTPTNAGTSTGGGSTAKRSAAEAAAGTGSPRPSTSQPQQQRLVATPGGTHNLSVKKPECANTAERPTKSRLTAAQLSPRPAMAEWAMDTTPS